MNISAFNRDLLQQVYLMQNTTTEGWSLNQLEAELTNPFAEGFCAVIDNSVAAYLSCHIVCDEATINNVITIETFRRKGIAKSLINHLVNVLGDRGVSKVFLEVRSKNIAAISLYEGLGFIQNGKRPGFYSNPKDDALLYVKEIL